MLQMCEEKKVPVVAGTDAHFSSAVGVFDHVEVLLQEMNFPEELVVNRSVDVLKQEILRNNPVCPTDHPRSNGVRRIDLSGS